ncbi:MAG: BlaI/MecI/CopY family transcriptional regulator [Sphingosinicella sp.]|nr:BlaI/MecI/CopY family transcriptional regulator [Sphingosinicella sp.]
MATKSFHTERSGAAVAVGPLESQVLDVLWEQGDFFGVPDIHRTLTEKGREISYSAVKAVLNNLADKGWLAKEKRGKVTYFDACKSREEFDALVMTSVIGSLKRNYGTPVIAQFIDQLAVDEETLDEFDRLIKQRKAELGK